MLLHRCELDYLVEWHGRSDRKPLLMRGARQVGKSTLVKLLAQKQGVQCVTLDFEQHPEDAVLFASKVPTTILRLLSAQRNETLVPEHIILFLDEVQNAPEVLQTLRYFYEQMPNLPVIAAGSLLDFTLKDIQFSMPVGRLEYLYVMPLGYEDFLAATQQTQLLVYLKNYTLDQTIPEPIHNQLMRTVKTYCLIGGLPEVVASYQEKEDFREVARLQQGLLQSYQDDFAKYATRAEQARMRTIFNKVPLVLGEKFKYSAIDPHQQSASIKAALEHLVLARIVQPVYHTAANGLPLAAEVNPKHFKTYFLDVGLVSAALNVNLLDLQKAPDLTLVNAGKIAEQFVAQTLLQFRELYESPNLYYWVREEKSSAAELDFVIAMHGKVIPIEVKAGATGSLKSLHYFFKEKNRTLGVRLCGQLPSLLHTKVRIQEEEVSFTLLSLPFYLAGQLGRLAAGL